MDNDALLILTVMMTSTAITLAALFVFQDVLMLAEDGALCGQAHSTSFDSSNATTVTAHAMAMQNNASSDESDDLFLLENAAHEEEGEAGMLVDDGGVEDGVENLEVAFIGPGEEGFVPVNALEVANGHDVEMAMAVTTTVFEDGQTVQQTTASIGETVAAADELHNAHNHPGNSHLPINATGGFATAGPIIESAPAIQRPRPAPLIRHDSTQSEDHNMTCLHFFSITNRDAQDFTKILTETTSQTLNVNSRVRYLHLSALHFAAMNATVEAMEELRKFGANVDSQDALGKTPLRHAVMLRRMDVVSYLLSVGAQDRPDIYGCSALRYALIKIHVDTVSGYLLNRPESAAAAMEGGSMDKPDPKHCPIHVAANSGSEEMVRVLLEFGAEVDGRDGLGRTGLMYAAIQGHVGVTRVILGLEGIEKAEQIVALRADSDLTVGEEVEGSGWMETIGEDGLGFLFNRKVKADVNAIDSHGWTALHYAAACTKETAPQNIHLLASEGAKINATAFKYNLTPLHIAAKSGISSTLTTLLHLGADPTIVTTDLRSPMHFAAQGGHVECVKILLAHDASLANVGVKGKLAEDTSSDILRLSPLHMAIRGPQKEAEKIVRILLDSKADVTTPVPIEVEGWISWGNMWSFGGDRSVTNKKKKRKSVDPITGIEKEMSIVYVSPVSFAIAAGQLDIAKLLLTQRPMGGWFWSIGLSQFILCMVVALGSRRWDIAWRLVFKTPVGIGAAILLVLVVFVRICIFTTPPVTQSLMKEAWELCLQRRGKYMWFFFLVRMQCA
ncbi:Ankyrin repeat domain-containing protein 16 [Dinochytrium kinnereticum]|nr:Ankyrin repeat domain-containing protein 16 [Dinochytrium kinnereticum]